MSTPPSAHRLMEVIALAQATLARLRAEDGLLLESEIELRFALIDEGVSVDDVISRLGRAALDAEVMVEVTKTRMDRLKARYERFVRREETIRATLLQAMQAVGMKSFHDPEFSASFSQGKSSVLITDAESLPDYAVRIKREPNKTAIAEYLQVGPVPGAVLSNGGDVLTLRSK
jgi:hypothetical protein